jgi:hypothetical protein
MIRRLMCVAFVVLVSLVVASSAAASFGLRRATLAETNQDGSPDIQAGSHPYALTAAFTLKHRPVNGEERIAGGGTLKSETLELPPGFVGDPNAMPKCSYAAFLSGGSGSCPEDTVVGISDTFIDENATMVVDANFPVYNMEPSPGVAAEFAFLVQGLVPVFINVSVRTGGDYGLTVQVPDISQAADILASKVTIWGVPAEKSHDALRGPCLPQNEVFYENEEFAGSGLLEGEDEQEGAHASLGNCGVNVPVKPLLTNSTSCGAPRPAKVTVESWGEPGEPASKSEMTPILPELVGCEKLNFSPTIGVSPDGTAGSTPTGLNVDLHVPQESTVNPLGLAEADVKNTTVALPAGVQLSPSAADGLQACSNAQIGFTGVNGQSGMDEFTPATPSCPDASKIATVQIKTPLLEEELTGAVYLAAPQNFIGGPLENPFGSLLALYLVAEDPIRGVLVKLPGKVVTDPVTGQITASFQDTPQLPFSDLKLQFYGTARAPLTTPALCGAYTTSASFVPWTATPAANPGSTFQITSGPAGSPCSNPLPFAPGFESGSTNLQAGAFTPFELTMSRPDGNQTLSRIEMQMPPGLLGTLSHVKLCGEPQAAQGTCGEESLIGHTIISAGLGNDPYTVTGGKVFITTAYGGGQYGLSIVNPATAGPFVLEEGRPVVVRASVSVDVHTAALRIKSDPLPTILDGIPLQIQHVNVSVNRELFTFNPTNCNKMAIDGTLSGTEGASAAVSSPFQVTNCATLAFKPKFAVSTSGKTSRTNGASLHVKLTYPEGPYDANIAAVKVDLPRELPSRLKTLQNACLARVFEANPAACPAASIVGHAKAITPVLPATLEGPAYFVSHGGEAFPQLIVVLQGYGATVDLVGDTFISKAGITSSTFKTVPDVPVGTFELTLPQGKLSALAANGNLCKSKLKMPTAFRAQNGAQIKQSTPISVTGCPKAKKKKKKKQ